MLNRAPSTSTIKIHKSIKVVVVGDGAVGKTALLIYYTTKSFPHEYLPTVFDNYSCIEMFEQKPISIVLWDTAGQEDYDKLRPLSYPQTDVFLVCYSVISRDSFENIKSKWMKEIAPIGAPFIIVGTKEDLRHDKKTLAEIGPDNLVTFQEGLELAQELGAGAYMECSALSGSGINDIFQETIRQSLNKSQKAKPKPKGKEEVDEAEKEKEKEREKKDLKKETTKEKLDKEKEKEREKEKIKEREREKEKEREREKEKEREKLVKEKDKAKEREKARDIKREKSKSLSERHSEEGIGRSSPVPITPKHNTLPPSASPPMVSSAPPTTSRWSFFKKFMSTKK